jgi:hypothetical protein
VSFRAPRSKDSDEDDGNKLLLSEVGVHDASCRLWYVVIFAISLYTSCRMIQCENSPRLDRTDLAWNSSFVASESDGFPISASVVAPYV